MSTVKAQLLDLKNKGHLFHGSSNPNITVLEPRQTYDKSNPKNTDLAVFATDNFVWATIFGVWGGHTGWSTKTNSDGFVEARIPRNFKEEVENSKGCVYVLTRENFSVPDEDSQYKSRVAIVPITKIDVTLQDFLDLGGTITWLD